MHPRERAELARQAYQRAVAVARASSTPRSWGRLLAAAKNLQASLQGGGQRGAPNGTRRAATRERLPSRAPADARPDASPAATGCAAEPGTGAVIPTGEPMAAGHIAWPGLHEDLECARALRAQSHQLAMDARAIREQSRRLAMESRRLCAELAELLARSLARCLEAVPRD